MLEFVVAPDHPCLPGHFPGRPVVPGVVVLDRVLAAIEAVHGVQAALSMPQIKFMQPLLPGETARIDITPIDIKPSEITLSDAEAGRGRWRFSVLRGDTLLASGEVRAAADVATAP